eukprot:TRINITY_DN7292_c0_g1_i1.p1 TRINITY_DN7292_c0_g1~~TRINITY_DN7292_c0_g1_i1.p1  ORF type:complete len:240 (-),score=60.78 TRINITY_DN7292_c0_g1_i1:71-769(-)
MEEDRVEGSLESREDGRNPNQLRQLSLEEDILTRADGSAKFKSGKTEVLVAVHGPTEVKLSDEIIERATIDVAFQKKSGSNDYKIREIEKMMRSSLESIIVSTLHPRTLIAVVVQVLNDDGGVLSAAINAACLALLDAGVPLKSTIASVSCAIREDEKGNNIILLDPSKKEEFNSKSSFIFLFDQNYENGIVGCSTRGFFTQDQYFNCLKASRGAVAKIFTFMRLSAEKQLA